MSAFVVLWVGNRAPRPWEELARDYETRAGRLADLSQVRVRPEAGRQGDPRRALAQEAARIASHLRAGDHLVALDETGRQRSSEELAGWLDERWHLARVVFAIGSDLGLDAGLKAQAHETWSLSRLTLPHAFARLVVLEQLYRALDLRAGGAYHRRALDA